MIYFVRRSTLAVRRWIAARHERISTSLFYEENIFHRQHAFLNVARRTSHVDPGPYGLA